MKINITTTLDIDKEKLTQEDINQIYNDFLIIIENANRTKDLTDFLFINCDTREQIEDEVQ